MSTLRALFALVFIVSTSYSSAQIARMDEVVAIVDDDVVLSSELETRVASIKARFVEQPGQLPPEEVLRAQVLERLILENIQLQMAARAGVYIPDEQVSAAFSQLAANQGMPPNDFMNQLNVQGQSVTTIMRQLRRELTLQEIQQGMVSGRIEVTQAEIDNFLRSAEGQFWQSPTLNLRHIQLSLGSNASPGEIATAQATADNIMEKLSQGEKFEALAVQYSKGPTALDGGDIGWRRVMEFPEDISASLIDVEVGDVTDPIRSAGGIHIFEVAGIQGGVQAEMVQQTHTRHILIKPNEIRSNEDARDQVTEIRERILGGETFEDMAAEYSEDIANSLKGGDLDWVLPGQMVPEFEAAMNATEVGDISYPVETQFGWHILRVDERREVDMSSDIMRNQAFGVLRNQRFPEELDLWLREIRGNAFVEIIE